MRIALIDTDSLYHYTNTYSRDSIDYRQLIDLYCEDCERIYIYVRKCSTSQSFVDFLKKIPNVYVIHSEHSVEVDLAIGAMMYRNEALKIFTMSRTITSYYKHLSNAVIYSYNSHVTTMKHIKLSGEVCGAAHKITE